MEPPLNLTEALSAAASLTTILSVYVVSRGATRQPNGIYGTVLIAIVEGWKPHVVGCRPPLAMAVVAVDDPEVSC